MHILLYCIFFQDIQNLSADSFEVREAAEARLTYYGDLTWPLLDRKFADPEKNRRARRIVYRTIPPCYSPIALLSGRPMTEWALPEELYGHVGSRPGPEWRLAWLYPDPHAPLAIVIHRYGEKARSQRTWLDWHSDADGCESTRLLCRDLLACGTPPCLVRKLCSYLEACKNAVEQMHPMQMERIP